MFRTADDSYSIEFFFFHTIFLGFAKQVQFVSIAKVFFLIFYFFSQTSTESSVETE